MLEDLENCRKKNLVFIAEVECCFHICERYWARLRNEVVHYVFEDEKEEIDFFKIIKPKFTSEVEYYSLLYHAELFKPVDGSSEIMNFWNRETKRFEKFVGANRKFYEYYKNGSTRKDKIFFTRSNNSLSNFPAASDDLEEKANSSHDWLIASLLALEKYTKYVKKRISDLVHRVK